MNLHVGDAEADVAVVFETPGDEVLEDLVLWVDGDGAAVRQFVEVDAVAASAEPQFDAVVGEPFTLDAVAESGVDHQVDGVLFEHTGPDRALHLLAGAAFEHGGIDALQVQEMGQHQSCGTPPTIPTCVFMSRLLA